MYPVTTGGTTNGKDNNVSRIALPLMVDLARIHPIAMANGNPIRVPNIADCSESRMILISSVENTLLFSPVKGLHQSLGYNLQSGT